MSASYDFPSEQVKGPAAHTSETFNDNEMKLWWG